MRPATYIGSDVDSNFRTYIYDNTTQKCVLTDLVYIEGVEKIFMEVLSNVYDNIDRSLQRSLNPGSVEVTIHDNATITVKNEGLPVNVQFLQQENMWSPQLIFGNLLAGSNFDDVKTGKSKNTGGGTNGIGIKSANIFSTYFRVVCCDPYNNIRYEQQWTNNMKQCHAPTIQQLNANTACTEITYSLDLARFQRVNATFRGYDEKYFALFMRHVADLACTGRVVTRCNNVTFRFDSPLDYAKLYVEHHNNPIVHYQWPTNAQVTKKKYVEQSNMLPEQMIVMLDAPNQGGCLSFVNGVYTRDGGVHVNEAYKSIGNKILQQCNEEVSKILTKGGKQNADSKELKACTVDIGDVKSNVFLLLVVRMLNPRYTNQTKSKVNGPTIDINLPDNAYNVVKKWRLQDQLFLKMELKQQKLLAKDTKKLGKRAIHVKGTDANLANSKSWERRKDCILCIAEGDSAVCYLLELIKLLQGRDSMGFLPLKGKPKNVMGMSPLETEKNVEMSALRSMLGLQFGVDYNIASNRQQLRYGKLMILADADVDGIHIAALVVNYFYTFFPALLVNNFVTIWRTPVIRVKGKVTYHNGHSEQINRKFYNLPHFETWMNSVQDISENSIHYYKGLGSSEKKDVKEDQQDAKVAIYNADAQTYQAMHLAFDKDWADHRKRWIANFAGIPVQENLPTVSLLPISQFIAHEFILYSIENMRRSLPDLLDGLKVSLRKVLYGALKRFSKRAGAEKVATFNAYVMELTKYHHGDAILPQVIIGMAQNYVGSNNVNLLLPIGMFGSRYIPKSASPRYIFTALNSITKKIFRDEDKGILTTIYDEGKKVEPERYYPIINYTMLNGCIGIGTGHSTNIPSFNLLDLINWIRGKLNNQPPLLLLPYYRGYKGVVKVVDNQQGYTFTCDYANCTHYNTVTPVITKIEGNPDKQMSVITEGRFHFVDNKFVITELPIDVNPKKYEKFLDGMLNENLITNYSAKSIDNDVYIEIEGFNFPADSTRESIMKTFNLVSINGLSNLTVLDENKNPHIYKSPNELMEAWFTARYDKYNTRKAYLLKTIEEKLVNLIHKRNFIQAVLENRIDIRRLDEEYIRPTLINLNIPYEIYDSTKVVDISKEKRAKLQAEIDQLSLEYRKIQETSIENMWLSDLQELENTYAAYLVTDYDKDTVGINYDKKKPQRKRK